MDQFACRDDYTYEKFVLYLYLCAAYSDYKINEDEKEVIREKMAKLGLIKLEDFDKSWAQVLHDFKMHNDLESMEHVQACSNMLNIDHVARVKIYNDFKDIVWADGKQDDAERINMFKFKKILNI
jgi:uncharacterized tellurite resistance protein B-like protein